MFVGIETESFPGQDIPGWILPPVDGRDAVYEALAETYRRTNNPATGTPYVVELLRGKAAFAFPPQPYVLPTIYEIFADGPRRIRLYHLGGTGGVMHLVDDFREFPVGQPRTRWMPHDGHITWMDGARRTKLIRVPEYAWQPTAELRIFDAVHRQLDPGAYQLDPESTRWFAQFAAAFGWKFGNQAFI